MKVWILVEEAEEGHFADFNTYLIHGAYSSMEKAEAARDACTEQHEFPMEVYNPDGNDTEISIWCSCCKPGVGFSIAEEEVDATAEPDAGQWGVTK
jgi:hypothetical protein